MKIVDIKQQEVDSFNEKYLEFQSFPSGSTVKNCNAGGTGDAGSIPGLGRFPGGGNGNLF